MAVRTVVVDDHEIMREGIGALLRKCGDIELVGQAGDGRSAVELVIQLRPDLVIMDIGMPKLNGIDATRQMIQLLPDIKVMALSAHADNQIISQMILAGARGYMHKESTFSEMKDGITAMLEGKTFLCSRISKVVFSDYINILTNPNSIETDGLSLREREVLQLVAEGYTSKEIGKIIKLSPKTVETHREHIMNKLKIHTIPGLTKYAVQKGLTTL
jgi:DNA-binding NarL/FixJ family response regulator